MPLHLLGKKSWNVYNSENIARVQRDEAEAKAKDEEEERRMQEVDAENRMNLLRRSGTARIEAAPAAEDAQQNVERVHYKKKRRIQGEDDTDRDMRLAREHASATSQLSRGLPRTPTSEPLVDHRGHINLFPEARKQRSDKNEEAEAEAAKKKKELEDQYTMRFSNAAGYKPGSDKPWYTTSTNAGLDSQEIVGKDVSGNEDLGRRRREEQRVNSSDPLAAMKKGVKQLREAEQHRKGWMAQRERDLNEVEELARKHRRNRKRRSSTDSLEGFSLDNHHHHTGDDLTRSNKDTEGRRHRHHHRGRDRNRPRKHHPKRSRSPETHHS